MNPAPVGVASTNLALAGFEKTESSTPLLGNIFEYLNFNKKLSYCSDSAQCGRLWSSIVVPIYYPSIVT